MREVVIVSAARTPIGSFGGSLKDIPTRKLGAIAIKGAVERAGIKPEMVDEVIMGAVLQGGLGQNVARQMTLDAGLPIEVPAMTINKVCGSGLRAVELAAQIIKAGDADIIVAGGAENMSATAYAMPAARWGARMNNTQMVDMMVNDGLWDAFNDYHMIKTADNICEQWGLTREELDVFAANSQQKAAAAQESGAFDAEIVPVMVKKKKETIEFKKDEGPRPGTTVETLAKLRTINPGGFVTAGNASGINDGAAAIVVMSEEKAKELGVKPMATFVAGALAGVDPSIMGIGPVAATKKVMAKTGMKIEDFDIIEANEAFAAQSVAVGKDLGIDTEKQLNPNGGAIALGHPVGASGCRILVTLLHEMQARGAKTGLATLCIGGGMGCSTIVKIED